MALDRGALAPRVFADALAHELLRSVASRSGVGADGASNDATARGELAALAVMRVYHSAAGRAEYIGEQVSQLEHAAQAAHFALEEPGTPEAVVLGALLHDVGHLLPGLPQMAGDLGVRRHEEYGAEFLRALGLHRDSCAVVRGHVQAKRYLCWRTPAYHAQLSPASRGTLAQQGGPMTEAEATAFEADPLFTAIVKMRTWDEKAKVVHPDFVPRPVHAWTDALARSAARQIARDQYEREGYVLLKRLLSPEMKRKVVDWCTEMESWEPRAGHMWHYYELIEGREELCRIENFLPFHDQLREFLTTGELAEMLREAMGGAAVRGFRGGPLS